MDGRKGERQLEEHVFQISNPYWNTWILQSDDPKAVKIFFRRMGMALNKLRDAEVLDWLQVHLKYNATKFLLAENTVPDEAFKNIPIAEKFNVKIYLSKMWNGIAYLYTHSEFLMYSFV